MLFNSLQFLIFFPLVVATYFILPYRHRWILLLAASYYFYMAWKPVYIILIIISTLIDYFASIKMSDTDDKRKRKKYLMISVVMNLGILFLFKYYNFFSSSAKSVLEYLNLPVIFPKFDLLLPIGISFYTFQTMSYTIDVYRGDTKAERHLGIFALFVTFFPQLVAGPIERSSNLLPQFREEHDFDYDLATNGLKLMAWGFFKKVVIADRVAVLVNQVYNNVYEYSGIQLVLATVLFAYQIYCDFSGYSDIAIGSAHVMGYRLMTNFRRPYFARSIREFWKRWHISLSTWFQDYVYIPLGGNRVAKWRWQYNLFITFLVSGLWHGADWTFVIWGALHGFYLVFGIWTKGIREKFVKAIRLDKVPFLYRLIQMIIVFVLVNIGWIFFRANSVADAIYILKNISFAGKDILNLGLNKFHLIIAFASIFMLEFVQLLQETGINIRESISRKPIVIRWSLYYILVLWIIFFAKLGSQEFIYFQF